MTFRKNLPLLHRSRYEPPFTTHAESNMVDTFTEKKVWRAFWARFRQIGESASETGINYYSRYVTLME